jgi:hypothetical protein
MNATQPTHAVEEKAKPTDGREANGQFAPGNAGGPGNPFARKVAALRKAIVEAITQEDVKEIVAVLKQQAKEGSAAAIKLIFQYAIGKPGAENDPDRVDLGGWQLLREPARSDAVATRPDGTPPAGGKSAVPGSVPAGLVDRLALSGLGAEHVSILGSRPTLPNGEIGARESREEKPG